MGTDSLVEDRRGIGEMSRGGFLALQLLVMLAFLAFFHGVVGDDAYISFRYARNLVDGHGLVFNPGERVEGYTNFLWVLGIAAGLSLGASAETTSLSLGVVSGVVGIAATLWLAGALTHSRWRFLAPAMLGASSPFAFW